MSTENIETIQEITISLIDSNSALGRIDWNIDIPARSKGYVGAPLGYKFRPFSPLVIIQSLEWSVDGEPLLSYEMNAGFARKQRLPNKYDKLDPIWYWTTKGEFRVNVRATAKVNQDGVWGIEHRERSATWTIGSPTVENLMTKAVRPFFVDIDPGLHINTSWISMGWISEEIPDLNNRGWIMSADIDKEESAPDGELRCVQLVKPFRVTMHADGTSSQYETVDYRLDRSDNPPAYGEDVEFVTKTKFIQDDSPMNEVLHSDPDFVWRDKFKMYFMFKPFFAGSIWVTLCKVDWELDVRAKNGINIVKNIYPNMSTGGTATITERNTELPEWEGMVRQEDVIRHENIHLIEYQRDARLWAIIQSHLPTGTDSSIEDITGRKSCIDDFPIKGKNYSLFWGPKDVLTSSKLKLEKLEEFPLDTKYQSLNMDHLTEMTYRVDIAPFCFGTSVQYWKRFAYADVIEKNVDYSAETYLKRMRLAFPLANCVLTSEKEMIIKFNQIPIPQDIRTVCRHPQTFFIDAGRA